MKSLAKLLGGVSLFATVVLAVILIGQVVYGPGRMLLPSLLGAPFAFLVAWTCSNHLAMAERAERKRLEALPRPVPMTQGEFVMRARWVKWLAAIFLFGGFSLVAFLGLVGMGLAMKEKHVLPVAFAVAVLVPASLLLAETGRRAARLGGIARLDEQGFRHCLLPAVSWRQVRGVDLELQVPLRGPRSWNLVLAVDLALARTLRLGWWWRVLVPGAPRVDEEGRLTVPLAYARGKPQDLVGMAMSVADRWGAQRIPEWRAWEDPDWAARMRPARVSSEEAARTVERLINQLRMKRGAQHG